MEESISCKIDIEDLNLDEIDNRDSKPQIETLDEAMQVAENCIRVKLEETEFVEVQQSQNASESKIGLEKIEK